MRQTKAAGLADKLAAIGYHEVKSTSRKYRKFCRGAHTIWLGKCGALRAGRTVSDSISLQGI